MRTGWIVVAAIVGCSNDAASPANTMGGDGGDGAGVITDGSIAADGSRAPDGSLTDASRPSDARASEAAPPSDGAAEGGATLGGCAIFPGDNAWNRDISADPVHPNSDAIIQHIQSSGETTLKADFGSDPTYGIPYVVVPSSQAAVPIQFNEYPSESDPGPYPIPSTAPVEAGNDHHVLVLQSGTCTLFELYHATRSGSGWTAGSGAKFNLSSDALRPAGWTSCDQAGLPILPGLARYDEARGGAIRHALRFTVWSTQNGWIAPATHPGGSSNANAPPMGMRLRLKASYDLSHVTGLSRTILVALRTYGMFVADTGANWYVSGATDTRWDDDDLQQLTAVPGTAFEVVYTGAVQR